MDGAPERTRTSNLLIRSQVLYPIELRALNSVRRLPQDSLFRKKFLRFYTKEHHENVNHQKGNQCCENNQRICFLNI